MTNMAKIKKYEPHYEKTNSVVFEQVRHLPSCTSTDDDQRPEMLDLEVEELYYLCSENKCS